ncbi:MAG: hypothetical protein AABZ34_08175 [Nitrospirota bacterium]
MPIASKRIPVLVTKGDKTRFEKKAKSFGFRSMSEFARTAMNRFDHRTPTDAAAFEGLLKTVRDGTQEAERAIDHTLARCDASNKRMAALDHWMHQKGYL